MNRMMELLTSQKLEANLDEELPEGGGAAPSDGEEQQPGGEEEYGEEEYGEEDWRTAYGEEMMPTLERYSNEEAFGKAFMEQRQRLSQGGISKPLPDNATDEDIAAWRTENNIPLESIGYLQNMPEGLVLGEEDEEAFGSLAEAMHEDNIEPEILHGILDWYNDYKDSEIAGIEQRDEEDSYAISDLLRDEMGVSDFRTNVNIINSFLANELGEEKAEMLKNARGPDGTALFNDPDILKFFSATARHIVPSSMIVGGGDPAGGEARKDEILSWMNAPQGSEDFNKYWKSEKVQIEYRKILEIEANQGQRTL